MRIWKSYKTKLNHQVQCNELNYKLILFSLFWGVSFREKEVGYIYILLRERERERERTQSKAKHTPNYSPKNSSM
jgi:hypothetical protein